MLRDDGTNGGRSLSCNCWVASWISAPSTSYVACGQDLSPGETSDFQSLQRIKVTKQEALQFFADCYGYTEPDSCPPPNNQQFSAEKHRVLPS